MAANLKRKLDRRKGMRAHFEGTLKAVTDCLIDPESKEARLLGLKASLVSAVGAVEGVRRGNCEHCRPC